MLTFTVGRMINPVIVAASVAALINTGEPVLGGVFDALVGWFLDLQWHGHMHHGVKIFSVYHYQIAFAILPLSMLLALVLLLRMREK